MNDSNPSPSQLARVIEIVRQLNARIDAVEKLLAERLDAIEKQLAAAEAEAHRANLRARDLEDDAYYENGGAYVDRA